MSFIIGIIICAAALFMVVIEGGNPARLLDYKAIILVMAGTVGAMFTISPLPAIIQNVSTAVSTLSKKENSKKLLLQIMELVLTARREGILALDGLEIEIKNVILKKGLTLVAESADRETIKSILLKEMESMQEKEKASREFFESIAMISPVIGVIGTLVEIVKMLYTYKGATMLAPGIAKALLPIVYGVVVAYLLIMPLASRIKAGSDRLKRQRELAFQGVLAIQAGEPPHIAEQRLLIYTDENEKTRNK